MSTIFLYSESIDDKRDINLNMNIVLDDDNKAQGNPNEIVVGIRLRNHSKQQHIISNKYASHYLPGPQEGSGGFYGSPHGFAPGPPVFPPPARYSAVLPNYPPPGPQPYSRAEPYPGQYSNELGI